MGQYLEEKYTQEWSYGDKNSPQSEEIRQDIIISNDYHSRMDETNNIIKEYTQTYTHSHTHSQMHITN